MSLYPIRRLAAVLVFLGVSVTAHAESMKLSDAMPALAGQWIGVLSYRDFQTDKRVSIPHNRTIRVGPNGGYAMSENAYTDPGYKVYSAEMYRASMRGLTIASTTRDGIETTQYTLLKLDGDTSAWEAVFEGRGTDNDQPADVQIHISTSVDALTIRRMVRPVGEDAFAFRNEMVFNRFE